MSITSNLFLTGLLPLTIIITLFFRKNVTRQNVFLIIINTVFLLFSGIGGVVLLAVTCIVDYLFVRFIQKDNTSKKAMALFVVSLILNIAPLLFYKYTGFFLSSVNSAFGMEISIPQLIAPVGISFYTFQAISLLSDVKTGKIKYRPKFFEIYFYLTFFTTITSGPIVRFDDIREKYNDRAIVASDVNAGLTRFAIGLSKKVLLANNLATFADKIFSLSESRSDLSILGFWMGSIAFTLQLYMDFSGYSDMVIGIAKVLGFHIPENFDYPYTAKSIQEFWRKWHISLSRWFRDYIYIPLGGNRVSKARHIFNLLIVWLLTGFWHGANWTFILWGLLYFVLLVFEKYCTKVSDFFSKHFIGHIYALFFVNLLWVFFRATSIQNAVYYIGGMFGVNSITNPIEISFLHTVPFLLICFIGCFPIKRILDKYHGKVAFEIIKAIVLCALLALSIVSISSSSFTPFIYGQF